jgi:hypothetical protein
MAKQTQNETPRRRGRPKSFPGQETKKLLSEITLEAREMLGEVVEKRGEPLNVTLDTIIRRAHRDAMRSRGRKKAAAPAPEPTAE